MVEANMEEAKIFRKRKWGERFSESKGLFRGAGDGIYARICW